MIIIKPESIIKSCVFEIEKMVLDYATHQPVPILSNIVYLRLVRIFSW